ncbi:MAG: DUF1990 domain-containing protein [Saprospiraceae bacterium]
MLPRPFIPSKVTLAQWLSTAALSAHSYPEVGASRGDFPVAYDHDHNKTYLGEGDKTFEAAKWAIHNWHMFPAPWTKVYPYPAPLQKGTAVLVLFRLFGLWWVNPCRIIYIVDEKMRFGFAYGTLPGHVEKGEEYFGVYQDEAGKVWYEIHAFSRPAHWAVRLSYPLSRRFQRRFVRGSLARMREATSEAKG